MEVSDGIDTKAAYAAVGADYEGVLRRLASPERIEKYLRMFMEDTLIQQLEDAYASRDYDAMFLAAHTMKGNAGTLGLTALFESSRNLTEALRAKEHGDIDVLLSAVRTDFAALEEATSCK